MKQSLRVKGTSRRVVVIPTDDDSVFEQVICIVRDDAPAISAEAVLREAECALSIRSGEERQAHALERILLAILCALVIVMVIILIWCCFYAV